MFTKQVRHKFLIVSETTFAFHPFINEAIKTPIYVTKRRNNPLDDPRVLPPDEKERVKNKTVPGEREIIMQNGSLRTRELIGNFYCNDPKRAKG